MQSRQVVETPDTVQRLLHASRVGDAMTARLATWLLEQRGQIVDLPISRFAQETFVTETSIVRFCKALGYSGYRKLRLTLAQSVGIAKGLQLGADDRKIPDADDGSLLSLAKRIVATNTDVLNRTPQLLDERSLQRAIEALLEGTVIHLVGFGSSTPIALDLYQRLLRLGIRASTCSDPHILTVITTHMDSSAVLFGITYSGQSRDLVDALKAAKERKATTVVLTSNGGATASRLADKIGQVPLVPYWRPSSAKLAAALAPYCTKHNTFLLQNHGATAVGKTVREAYQRLEVVEAYAKTVWVAASPGGVKPFPQAAIEDLPSPTFS
jgi:DNA-binding MurR/RpiR family transcriptional regulator